MPHVDSYIFGMIGIDGHQYTSDVKIFPDGVKGGWWREEGHVLHLDDILPRPLVRGQRDTVDGSRGHRRYIPVGGVICRESGVQRHLVVACTLHTRGHD